MEDSIVTRQLTKRFGNVVAVDCINLQIPNGALFGLIGPNGAGKTTTLRMLAGLLEPTEGVIRINGLTVRQYRRELQWQIGYMPDFFGVYEDMLVWEYLDFFARCYNLSPRHRQKVTKELLELVDLSNKRDVFVHTLSRGMQQRLCLAHALVHDPKVLLLDEPASGLDPRARVEMRALLRELGNMGKTIVLSSHILSELAELCDAIGIIEAGNLIASGPISQIRLRASKTRMFRIKTLSNPLELAAYLQKCPHISKILNNESDDMLTIEFTGDDGAAADLLHSIMEHNHRIASFSEMATDLEDIFLQLTSGKPL